MGSLSNPNAFSGIVKGLGEGGSSVDFPTDITNPQDGQLLKYDATSEKWVNVDNETCVVDIVITNELREATSDDYDNYKYDNEDNPIQVGNTYNISSLGVSINDLESNKVFRYKTVDNSSGNYTYIFDISYTYENSVYKLELVSFPENIVTFYVVNKNLEIKLFIPYTQDDLNQ